MSTYVLTCMLQNTTTHLAMWDASKEVLAVPRITCTDCSGFMNNKCSKTPLVFAHPLLSSPTLASYSAWHMSATWHCTMLHNVHIARSDMMHCTTKHPQHSTTIDQQVPKQRVFVLIITLQRKTDHDNYNDVGIYPTYRYGNTLAILGH